MQQTRRKNAELKLAQNERKYQRLSEEQCGYRRRLEEVQQTEARVRQEIDRTAAELEEAVRNLDENNRLLTRRRDELSLRRGRLSGICERAALLETHAPWTGVLGRLT